MIFGQTSGKRCNRYLKAIRLIQIYLDPALVAPWCNPTGWRAKRRRSKFMQNCHCQLNSSTEPKDGLFLNQKQTEYFSFYNCLKILLTTMGCKAGRMFMRWPNTLYWRSLICVNSCRALWSLVKSSCPMSISVSVRCFSWWRNCLEIFIWLFYVVETLMKKSMFKTKISQAEAEEQPQTESKDDSVYCHFPVLCLCVFVCECSMRN